MGQSSSPRGWPLQVNGALVDMTGFHPRRNEFEPEWDNAAECNMAELEFREDDTEVWGCSPTASSTPLCHASTWWD